MARRTSGAELIESLRRLRHALHDLRLAVTPTGTLPWGKPPLRVFRAWF